MATAEIAVYTTQQAYNDDPDKQDVIKNYLEETYSQVDDHTIDVKTPTHHPDPPTEKHGQEACNPCGNGYCYDDLWRWWKKYHQCHGLYDAKDCNLLVTDANAPGGLGAGDYAVARGRQIRYLSTTSTTSRDCGSGHEAMGTVIHEAGHCVKLQHEDGYGYEDPFDETEYYTTPVLKGYIEKFDESTNDCGHYIDDYNSTIHDKCVEIYYSDCNENLNMEIK